MLRAQETGHRGRGGYSQLTISGANEPAPFPQAQVESRDFESFFRLFPDYLIRDALAGKEVLDFGSGYGGRTVEYKLCGAKRVCGIEPFENVIELSRQYAESRGVDVEFKVCDQQSIPYPDESFDIVISYDVLEHVADPRVSIAEIGRVLRPGGLSLNVFPVYYGARSHHLDYIVNAPGLHWLFPARILVKAVNSILSENPHFGTALQPEPRCSFDGSRYVLPMLNGLSGWHLKALFEGFEIISLARHPVVSSKPRLTRIAAAVVSSSLPTIIRDAATNNVACVLRKPGPADTVPLSATSQIPITPLKPTGWALVSPTHLNGDRITIRGTVPDAGSYAAVSPTYLLPKGTRVGATGTVRRGGLVFGLLDSNDQWAAQVAVARGNFRRFIEAPAEGTYRIVIANNLRAGQTINDVDVDEIGLVGLDPAQQRVPPPKQKREIAQITPLEVDAWETVFPATRQEGKGLRIEGEPASALAYGAVSARYQLTKGALIAAAGTVRRGGIVLGLLDNSSQQWAVTTAIEEGTFRTGVEAPVAGEYRIVIANNLLAGQTINDVDVDEIGLVGLDPAKHRIRESHF
jgi:SAM-dependent methyltransferase